MRLILGFLGLMLALVAPARADTINAVVGDASWTAAFGSVPDADADETQRIQLHLAYVLDRLRERDVTDLPAVTRERRAAALDSLERYLARGEFPLRTEDRLPGRRPRFIDARGVHCAVGQLIADSGAPDLARRINATYEYAFVHEMHAPELLAWATHSGFTVDELAMIQPTYEHPVLTVRKRKLIEELAEWITLQCAAHNPPPAKLTIRAAGDKHGLMTVTTKSKDPFARCFVAAANLIARDQPDFPPEAYQLEAVIELPSPQAVLERRFAGLAFILPCAPRPGAIVRKARFNIRTSESGIRVKVTTTPANAEVTACFERQYTEAFGQFGPGTWKLAIDRERTIEPRMSSIMLEVALRQTAPSIATDCWPPNQPPRRVMIAVIARRDAEKFAITADSSGLHSFEACFVPKLNAAIRQEFTLMLPVGDPSTYQEQPYFRIDNDSAANWKLLVETPEQRDVRTGRPPQPR